MKQLSPPDFGWARQLVERSPNKGCTAFIYSVLDNRLKGQVTVEAEKAPRAAIIAAKTTAYLFTEADFTSFKTLSPFLMEYLQSSVSDEGVTLWATLPEQVAVLQTMFSLEARRNVFSFPDVLDLSGTLVGNLKNNLREQEDQQYSDGYRLETFFYKGEERGEEASSLEGVTCFGVRMVHADMTVSACHSDLFAGGEAEIQIRTHPDYRRKGLAFKTARRFMEQARAYALRPAWSCDEDNIASHALATRLGFTDGSCLHGYYLHPAFLAWRQDARGKIGPSPEAETAGFEEEAVVKAADTVLHCLLEAYEASTVQEHPLQMLILPQPDGIAAQLIEENSCRVIQTFPLEMRAALTAQLKSRAGMHIDRQGFPQRGRFAVDQGTQGAAERIVRLAVYPSEYGEKMLLSVA